MFKENKDVRIRDPRDARRTGGQDEHHDLPRRTTTTNKQVLDQNATYPIAKPSHVVTSTGIITASNLPLLDFAGLSANVYCQHAFR